MTSANPAPAVSSTATLSWRWARAGIGATMGLCVGGMIWLYNWLTGQHVEVLVTTLVMVMVQSGIGFFVPPRKATWLDAILYFLLLNFTDI